ncbi:capsule assembly Wzi family protein [Salinimicrobium xinjiangense]|uniref:capsule assembly Wzi family protein n=1 Tax=Salinimicrobium xinjiangense TaxID=438596 RepID=UPI000684AE84|nr:capsule assembly Wzi family protein [Salinimicrobium xinjiangense]
MTCKHVSVSSIILLLIFFNATTALSQTTYSAEVELKAQISTKEELPFWMYSNQRGRISPETHIMGLATARMQHQLGGKGILEIGAGGVVHDGFTKKRALDEAYIQLKNQHFYVTGGVKQKEELYYGLSATNENILWSLNARSLPGLEIGTTKPVFALPGVGFEGRWGEYILEEERHVPWARVHHKKINIVLQPAEDWEIKAGIQHFAQWGGVSPDRGRQPESFIDYLRVFAGRQGGERALQGDINNSLGNHLGSWEVQVKKAFNDHSLQFIFNNIFEDGSGSRLANFPDGRYGLFWENEESAALISGLLYEFYYTKHQSHDVNRWGADNYLNHLMTYNSGWSYFDQVIGSPFFLYDKQQDRIINNKFTAHHFGLAGNLGTFFNPYPFKVMLSYRNNEGSYYRDPYTADREPKILSTYLTTRLYNGDFEFDIPRLTLNFLFAADFNSLLDPNFGAGVSLKYIIL